MQNRYVGDIGDFGKYGLLRALCASGDAPASPGLSLGVVWHLVPDEPRDGNGKLTQYLEPSAKNRASFRSCDPVLYDALQEIVGSTGRNVEAVRRRGILPRGTVFYDAPLTFEGTPSHGPSAMRMRLALRRRWARDALKATAGCDLVFVAPDNGLEIATTARHHKRGPKYGFFDELSPYLRRGQSLAIYQHIDHRSRAYGQIEKRLGQITDRLGECDQPFAMLYHRGPLRAFLIMPSQARSHLLFDKARRIVEGSWGQLHHFTMVLPKSVDPAAQPARPFPVFGVGLPGQSRARLRHAQTVGYPHGGARRSRPVAEG